MVGGGEGNRGGGEGRKWGEGGREGMGEGVKRRRDGGNWGKEGGVKRKRNIRGKWRMDRRGGRWEADGKKM